MCNNTIEAERGGITEAVVGRLPLSDVHDYGVALHFNAEDVKFVVARQLLLLGDEAAI